MQILHLQRKQNQKQKQKHTPTRTHTHPHTHPQTHAESDNAKWSHSCLRSLAGSSSRSTRHWKLVFAAKAKQARESAAQRGSRREPSRAKQRALSRFFFVFVRCALLRSAAFYSYSLGAVALLLLLLLLAAGGGSARVLCLSVCVRECVYCVRSAAALAVYACIL